MAQWQHGEFILQHFPLLYVTKMGQDKSQNRLFYGDIFVCFIVGPTVLIFCFYNVCMFA